MAMGEQRTLIDAAAKAGVKWILPTEYAGDGLNEAMVESVPLFHPKREARKQVEALAEREEGCEGVKWIGVATGPWMEFVCFLFLLFFLFFLATASERVSPPSILITLIRFVRTITSTNFKTQDQRANE